MSPNPLELVDWMYSRGLDKIFESIIFHHLYYIMQRELELQHYLERQ